MKAKTTFHVWYQGVCAPESPIIILIEVLSSPFLGRASLRYQKRQDSVTPSSLLVLAYFIQSLFLKCAFSHFLKRILNLYPPRDQNKTQAQPLCFSCLQKSAWTLLSVLLADWIERENKTHFACGSKRVSMNCYITWLKPTCAINWMSKVFCCLLKGQKHNMLKMHFVFPLREKQPQEWLSILNNELLMEPHLFLTLFIVMYCISVYPFIQRVWCGVWIL